MPAAHYSISVQLLPQRARLVTSFLLFLPFSWTAVYDIYVCVFHTRYRCMPTPLHMQAHGRRIRAFTSVAGSPAHHAFPRDLTHYLRIRALDDLLFSAGLRDLAWRSYYRSRACARADQAVFSVAALTHGRRRLSRLTKHMMAAGLTIPTSTSRVVHLQLRDLFLMCDLCVAVAACTRHSTCLPVAFTGIPFLVVAWHFVSPVD